MTGLPAEVLGGALKQAREARLFILEKMHAVIGEPRQAISPTAPRVITIQIPVDKIGEVIGPKGKRINEIIAETGADVDIQDDGRVFIGSKDGESAERARGMIDEIVNPRIPQAGETYEGKVVKTTPFGAFVNLTPAKDGLVHISRLGRGGQRVSAVEDVVNVGDIMKVRVREVDKLDRISLEPVWDDEEGKQRPGAREPRRDDRRSGDRRQPSGGDREGRRRRRRRPRGEPGEGE